MQVYPRGHKAVYYMNFVHQGKRICRSTGKYTKKEALAYAVEYRHQLESGSVEKPQLTLAQALERVYSERWCRIRDGKNQYQRVARVIAILGNPELRQITSSDLERLRGALFNSGNKPATVNRYLANLKTILNTAKNEWELLDKLPKIRMEKVAPGRIREFTEQEEKSILQKCLCNGYVELHDLFLLLINTGLRLSEALNLQKGDIDFDHNYIRIWQNKTDRPRSVPLTATARQVLLFGAYPFGLTKNLFEKQFYRVRVALGMKDDQSFVLHTCRHTFASRLVKKGVHIRAVQELLGHSNITTTERYSHLSSTHLEKVIKLLEG